MAGQVEELLSSSATCFNCESACGMLAYVDKDTGQVTKFEGNPHTLEAEEGIVPKDLQQLIKFKILSGYSTLFVELALEVREKSRNKSHGKRP